MHARAAASVLTRHDTSEMPANLHSTAAGGKRAKGEVARGSALLDSPGRGKVFVHAILGECAWPGVDQGLQVVGPPQAGARSALHTG